MTDTIRRINLKCEAAQAAIESRCTRIRPKNMPKAIWKHPIEYGGEDARCTRVPSKVG